MLGAKEADHLRGGVEGGVGEPGGLAQIGVEEPGSGADVENPGSGTDRGPLQNADNGSVGLGGLVRVPERGMVVEKRLRVHDAGSNSSTKRTYRANWGSAESVRASPFQGVIREGGAAVVRNFKAGMAARRELPALRRLYTFAAQNPDFQIGV